MLKSKTVMHGGELKPEYRLLPLMYMGWLTTSTQPPQLQQHGSAFHRGRSLAACRTEFVNRLGMGWGNSLVAFIALALTPVPFVFYVLGERIRKSGPVHL